MRSRYAGYALGLVDYIMLTTAEGADPASGDRAKWARDIEVFCSETVFESLEVIHASEDGDRGSVTFVAHLRQGERDASFREESTFVRRDERWLYLSGNSQPL